MKTYKVTLEFLYDDEEYPDIKTGEDAIFLAVDEINKQGPGILNYKVKVNEVLPASANRDPYIFSDEDIEDSFN